MLRLLTICYIAFWTTICYAQNYDTYFTGSATDAITSPEGGICLMGGATEEDEAMKWFLNRADGGDILVLRASGSDGYNDYLYNQLGVSVNSVETIAFNNSSASNEAYIQQKIDQAEAIWFAGGDQWDYISYWRNTAIDSLINIGLTQRNIVIGGTSAGMAIQGGVYFSAENGTVTSATALSDPFDANITADSSAFLQNAHLSNVITDTHYDNPDRKGRHLVFLARMWEDYGIAGKGIACDEYTAVCIDTSGIARVFGQHPTYDDNAYFLQVNCELTDPSPEIITAGSSLTWNHNGTAVKVYAVKGSLAGTNTFDLNDWQTGVGGEWQDWSVSNGILSESLGTVPNCENVSVVEAMKEETISIAPSPTSETLEIKVAHEKRYTVSIHTTDGQLIDVISNKQGTIHYNVSGLSSGIYLVSVRFEDGTSVQNKILVD